MKPITCTAKRNDITMSRSFSREADMQYERMTEMFAAMKPFHKLIIGIHIDQPDPTPTINLLANRIHFSLSVKFSAYT